MSKTGRLPITKQAVKIAYVLCVLPLVTRYGRDAASPAVPRNSGQAIAVTGNFTIPVP